MLGVVAVLDVVLTLFLPVLTGTYLAFAKSPAGLLRRPPQDPSLDRGRISRLRVALVAAPLVWQPMVGTQLLVERLFGVVCVLGIGMLLGTLARFIAARRRRNRAV